MLYEEREMPPKVKITKNDIITATLELVRKYGEDGINARTIANALNCSTQPIFSNFKGLEDLQTQVTKKAHDLYLEFLEREVSENKYPKYKAFGMGYIRFAKQEKQHFKFYIRNNTSLVCYNLFVLANAK